MGNVFARLCLLQVNQTPPDRRNQESRIARNDRSLKALSGVEATKTTESVARERSRERKRRDNQRIQTSGEEEP
jgi:hypothetical protein